jgi:hypothetical protein
MLCKLPWVISIILTERFLAQNLKIEFYNPKKEDYEYVKK